MAKFGKKSPKQNYLQRQAQNRAQEATCYGLWFTQLAVDTFTDVLNDQKVMGKDVMGKKRLNRIYAAFMSKWKDYVKALEKGDEAYYTRVKIDQKLEQIFGAEALPWVKRYDYWEEEDWKKR